jgi:hypothetical protein
MLAWKINVKGWAYALVIGACFVLIYGTGLLTGCKNPVVSEPDSKIVQTVASAGSGNLQGVSQAAIESWLQQHSNVATQISADCKVAYDKRDAKWQDTTEGRVCMGDAQVLMMMPHTVFVGHGGIHGTHGTGDKKSANK